MRYAQIRNMDISNGEGIGVALFVQGCDMTPHCKNCFNPDTWSFEDGEKWTVDKFNEFITLAGQSFIKRISILGGEPLCSQNCYEVFKLCKELKNKYFNKQIWIYSGYTYEELYNSRERFKPLLYSDVLVDGRYDENKKDLSLAFRGSTNQRIIDVQKTLKRNEIVLYEVNN